MEEESRPSRSQDPQEPAFDPWEWLSGGSPREVLLRLAEQDPFELPKRTWKRLEEGGWFVDPQRAVARAMARVAHGVFLPHDSRPFWDWLDERIDQAIQDLVNEQREEELRSVPIIDSADLGYYDEFAGVTEMEPALARLSCMVLNTLPPETRRAFFAIGVQGKTVEDYAVERDLSRDRVREHVEQAAVALVITFQDRIQDEEGGTG